MLVAHYNDDDERLDPIGPPSLPIERRHRRGEETVKITCCQVSREDVDR